MNLTQTVEVSQVPANALIAKELNQASFYDCYSLTVPSHFYTSALDLYLKTVGQTPAWFNFLMTLRNKVVKCFGLKDLGGINQLNRQKSASEYELGDRVGIFSMIANSTQEVLLADNDKHLRVVLSVYQHPNTINSLLTTYSVTTVVHIHNGWGKLYMLPVKPMHQFMVPIVFAKALQIQK
jgi:hypothetical protein